MTTLSFGRAIMCSLNQNEIFIISALNFLKSGNQVLFWTVKEFIRSGFKVHMITIPPTPRNVAQMADLKELFGDSLGNQFIFERRQHPLLPIWRKLERLHLRKSKSKIKRAKEEPFAQDLAHPLLRWLYWISYIIGFSFYGVRILLLRRKNIAFIYGYEVYGAAVGFILSKLFHLPFVTRYQGTILFPFLNQGWMRTFLKYPEHVFGLWVSRFANLVVMANDGTRGKEVLESMGVPSARILFLHDGVAPISPIEPQMLRKMEGLSSEQCLIVTVTRLDPWKRVDRALRAIKKAAKELGNFKYFIIGDGQERENLEHLAKSLEIDSQVVFKGFLTHLEAFSWIAASDVLLSTADHSNLVNSVLESLYLGRLIVSIKDGSLDEIAQYYSGLFLAKDEEELPTLLVKASRASKPIPDREIVKTWPDRIALELKAIQTSCAF